MDTKQKKIFGCGFCVVFITSIVLFACRGVLPIALTVRKVSNLVVFTFSVFINYIYIYIYIYIS